MTAYRYDPYLWVHLAGLATVPCWLGLCLLGLAVGFPTVPPLELTLVLGLGSVPVLYMQLRRPFSVFGVLFLALKPQALAEDRRVLLTVFRSWRVRLAAPWVTLLLVWVGLQLYRMAPVAADITPWSDWGRAWGLAIATLGFFGANLFLQVPVSVLQVMLTPKKTLQAAQPYPTHAINRDFVHVGLPVGKILPDMVPSEEDVSSGNDMLPENDIPPAKENRAHSLSIPADGPTPEPEDTAAESATSDSEAPRETTSGVQGW